MLLQSDRHLDDCVSLSTEIHRQAVEFMFTIDETIIILCTKGSGTCLGIMDKSICYYIHF